MAVINRMTWISSEKNVVFECYECDQAIVEVVEYKVPKKVI